MLSCVVLLGYSHLFCGSFVLFCCDPIGSVLLYSIMFHSILIGCALVVSEFESKIPSAQEKSN